MRQHLSMYDLNNIAAAEDDASVLKSILLMSPAQHSRRYCRNRPGAGLMDTEDVIFVPEKLEIYDKTSKMPLNDR